MPDETSTPGPEVFPFEKSAEPSRGVEIQTTEEKGETRKRPGDVILAEPSGVIRGSTFQDQYRLAKCYFESRLMPKALDSTEKVLVAIQLCHELGLPPMASIGKVCVINGSPSVFGELPLALVRRSGLLRSIEETCYIDEEIAGQRLNYACCIARRVGGEEVKRFFSVDDARVAGLWGKAGPWKLYPKRMLQMRARSWALKDLFPDVLMGVSILEYDHHETIETAPPTETIADELNKKFLNGGPDVA